MLGITWKMDHEYQQDLFICLATHLSNSHRMFSHRTTISFFVFWTYRRKVLRSILLSLEVLLPTDVMFHHIAKSPIEAFLRKNSFQPILILIFESKHV